MALVSAASFGGTNSDSGYGVTVDSAGNVTVTGDFRGTVDVDPGAGVTNLTSNGSADMFVVSYSPTGTLNWATSFGDTTFDSGEGVTVDSAGNVTVTGRFAGTVDVEPGAGVTNLTSNGERDVFIVSYSPTGTLNWATSFGDTDFDDGYGVAVDNAGNVTVTGYFVGTVDVEPGAGVTNLTSNGSNDVFIVSYSPTGTLNWATSFGDTTFDSSYGVAADSAGNVTVTGSFEGTVDVDPGAGVTNLTSNGSADMFIVSYSPTGTLNWATSFGNTNSDSGYGATVDSAGNVTVTGDFRGTVDVDPGAGVTNLTSNGSADVFIVSYSPTGTLNWVTSFGNTTFDYGNGVAADSAGNVTATGSFAGTVDVDPGAGVTNLTSNGSAEVFIVQYTDRLCDGLPVTVDVNNGDTPTSGDDVILGTPGDDVISAGDGNDTICGGDGNDTISGGDGTDTIYGEAGDDTLYGAAGNDTIDGGADNDTILGNAGLDDLYGGPGNDTISGNEDSDYLDGDAGDDTLYGGAGDDTINDEDGNTTVLGGAGADFITISGTGTNLISGNDGNDFIFGSSGTDTLYGAADDDTIFAGLDNTTILGGGGNDTIFGADGNDLISGNDGNDTIDGGAGDDTIYGVTGDDTILGGDNDDTILGGDGLDTIGGGFGNDLLSGNDGNDDVNGGPGTDEVYGANGNDTLDGGTGTDIILGGNNTDTITANDGQADQISGNAGTDTCTIDPGIDTAFACETLLP